MNSLSLCLLQIQKSDILTAANDDTLNGLGSVVIYYYEKAALKNERPTRQKLNGLNTLARP